MLMIFINCCQEYSNGYYYCQYVVAMFDLNAKNIYNWVDIDVYKLCCSKGTPINTIVLLFVIMM